MDTTEIHYVTYDPDEIWKEMQMAYVEAGGDPLYPGDEKEMLLRSVQADIVSVFAGIDNALRMQTIRYAVGDYLDLLGESRGCERLSARAATGHIKIVYQQSATAAEGYRTIAAGTLLTVDGSVNYALDQDLVMTETSGSLYGTITCTQEGSIGNGLTSGETLILADGTNPLITSITSMYDGTTGGRDKETDDEYRERMHTFMAGTMSVGTKDQYEQTVMGYDSRINQAHAKLDSSVVTVSIVCDDTSVEQTVSYGASNYLQENGLTVIGFSTAVQPATVKSYTLVLKITKSGLTKAQIDSVISEYKAWQDNILGRSFCPEKLIGMLYAAGCSSVTVQSGSSFNSGSAVYTTIREYERCQGTITWS